MNNVAVSDMRQIVIAEIARFAKLHSDMSLMAHEGALGAALLAAGLVALDRAETAYQPGRGHFAPYARREVRRAVARARALPKKGSWGTRVLHVADTAHIGFTTADRLLLAVEEESMIIQCSRPMRWARAS